MQDFVNLICENESEAIKTVKQLVDGRDVELWHGSRDRQIERSTAHDNKNTFRRCAVPFAATRELVLLVESILNHFLGDP